MYTQEPNYNQTMHCGSKSACRGYLKVKTYWHYWYEHTEPKWEKIGGKNCKWLPLLKSDAKMFLVAMDVRATYWAPAFSNTIN